MNKYNIYRIISLALVLLIIFLLQTNSSGFSLFGVKIDMIPAFICSVAITYDYIFSAGFGVFAGILVDVSRVNVEGIFSVFYMLFAVFAGFLFTKYFSAKISAVILSTTICMLITSLIIYASYILSMQGGNFLVFIKVMCSEILISLLFLPIVFYTIAYFEKIISKYESEVI